MSNPDTESNFIEDEPHQQLGPIKLIGPNVISRSIDHAETSRTKGLPLETIRDLVFSVAIEGESPALHKPWKDIASTVSVSEEGIRFSDSLQDWKYRTADLEDELHDPVLKDEWERFLREMENAFEPIKELITVLPNIQYAEFQNKRWYDFFLKLKTKGAELYSSPNLVDEASHTPEVGVHQVVDVISRVMDENMIDETEYELERNIIKRSKDKKLFNEFLDAVEKWGDAAGRLLDGLPPFVSYPVWRKCYRQLRTAANSVFTACVNFKRPLRAFVEDKWNTLFDDLDAQVQTLFESTSVSFLPLLRTLTKHDLQKINAEVNAQVKVPITITNDLKKIADSPQGTQYFEAYDQFIQDQQRIFQDIPNHLDYERFSTFLHEVKAAYRAFEPHIRGLPDRISSEVLESFQKNFDEVNRRVGEKLDVSVAATAHSSSVSSESLHDVEDRTMTHADLGLILQQVHKEFFLSRSDLIMLRSVESVTVRNKSFAERYRQFYRKQNLHIESLPSDIGKKDFRKWAKKAQEEIHRFRTVLKEALGESDGERIYTVWKQAFILTKKKCTEWFSATKDENSDTDTLCVKIRKQDLMDVCINVSNSYGQAVNNDVVDYLTDHLELGKAYTKDSDTYNSAQIAITSSLPRYIDRATMDAALLKLESALQDRISALSTLPKNIRTILETKFKAAHSEVLKGINALFSIEEKKRHRAVTTKEDSSSTRMSKEKFYYIFYTVDIKHGLNDEQLALLDDFADSHERGSDYRKACKSFADSVIQETNALPQRMTLSKALEHNERIRVLRTPIMEFWPLMDVKTQEMIRTVTDSIHEHLEINLREWFTRRSANNSTTVCSSAEGEISNDALDRIYESAVECYSLKGEEVIQCAQAINGHPDSEFFKKNYITFLAKTAKFQNLGPINFESFIEYMRNTRRSFTLDIRPYLPDLGQGMAKRIDSMWVDILQEIEGKVYEWFIQHDSTFFSIDK